MQVSTLDHLIAKVSNSIIAFNEVVVFIGAGGSTESGIPDFRSAGGLWNKHDPNDFIYQKFINSAESRKKYWEINAKLYYNIVNSEPNPAHYACVELEKMGKLDCVITQDVDNLPQKAGLNGNKIIELHGNTMVGLCLTCGKQYSRQEIQEWLEKGIAVPYCKECKGILKRATIGFGQSMPQRETQEAERRSRMCELFIVVGSSLVVHPAALMPSYVKKGGAKLVIINLVYTSYDGEADVMIRGKAGEVMFRIVEEVKEKMRI